MKRAVVLGAGGLIGMAYHAGALKALEEWGVDVGDADVLIGTSAGSVMASYLAAGWTPTDFYEYAHGRHPAARNDPEEQDEELREVFTPLWESRLDRARRTIGAVFVGASSRGYWQIAGRSLVPSPRLRRAFPSGMYSTAATRQRLYDDLPERWPREGLYICACELYSGRRVAFGAPGAPHAPLPDAVLASCAIPGVFPPVKIGDRHYVDGGAFSATSLDLALEQGCEAILCIAPLGYRSEGEVILREPRMWPAMVVRGLFARTLAREVREARAQGVDVFVIRPWLQELRAQGANTMRQFERGPIVDAAREGTLRLLEQNRDDPTLKRFQQKKRQRAG